MLKLNRIHHVAVICSDINRSKRFYTRVLGMEVQKEVYRESRKSWKVDLHLNGDYRIELFSFPNPPDRVSRPEAVGLRHLAFEVDNMDYAMEILEKLKVPAESVRTDEFTKKRFTFIVDPDGLPIELYER